MNYEEAARTLLDLLQEAGGATEDAAAVALEAAGAVHTEALLASLEAYNQALRLMQAGLGAQPPALTPAGAQLQPMSEQTETVRLDFPLTAAQFEALKPAHIPNDGWERWYLEYDEAQGALRYYRNASGFCFFIAQVEPAGDGYVVGDVVVNRNDKQYTEENIRVCAAQLKVLLANDLGLDDEPYWDEMDVEE